MPAPNVCRCCGKPVYSSDGAPVHTRCIVRHWQRHAKGKNVRRCREFGNKEVPDHTPDPMESPSEGVLMDYRHEIHDYLVEKGEREE